MAQPNSMGGRYAAASRSRPRPWSTGNHFVSLASLRRRVKCASSSPAAVSFTEHTSTGVSRHRARGAWRANRPTTSAAVRKPIKSFSSVYPYADRA